MANFQPKFNIPNGIKSEISLKGFTLGIKAEIIIINSIWPKLLINVELCGLLLGPSLKKGYHQIWEPNMQLLAPMFYYLLISRHQCSSSC
jgi:hypothetical protein